MKRLTAAVLIIVSLFSLSVASIFLIKKEAAELNGLLVKACDTAQSKNITQLIEITQEIQKEWKRSKKLLSFFLSHRELDDLAVNIASLDKFCKTENYDEYEKACFLNMCRLEHLVDSAKPKTENIL